MKKILLKRCESNGTDNYYFQGISSIYNFNHEKTTDTVYVFNKGTQIKAIKSTKELTDFINSISI